MSALRLLFALQNAAFFRQIDLSLFFVGFYFDAVTIALYGLPLFLFYLPFYVLPPSVFKGSRSHVIQQRLTQGYLILISLVILLLNCWDIAYFSYTQKRSVYSYFLHMLTGTEASSLAGEFLMEFWWLPLVFVCLLYALWRSISLVEPPAMRTPTKLGLLKFLVLFTLLIVLGRGGVQLRPVSIIDATAMSSFEQAPIVLNTAFTVLKTTDDSDEGLVQIHKEDALKKLLPQSDSDAHAILPKNTNVVILILESFGTNYAGPNSPKSYTPFLDSLVQKSLFFEFAVANGRTSMDAVPAILAGMPSWLPESYILSSYCSNQLNSLPQILNSKGYNTSFYHGAKEGSMNFKSFTKALGVSTYKGLESYPTQAHFDGNWGVWDHHMLQYFGRELNKKPEPFFSSIFTLSSHHPYKLPSSMKRNFKSGPEPLCKTISYTDYSLRQFFGRFQNEAWFKNTLFVITADHVGPTRQAQFQTIDWRYRIPIAFYHPTLTLSKPSKEIVFQQIDILPTVLDFLGLPPLSYQLGSSCFDRDQSQKMVYENGNLISFIYQGTHLLPLAWSPGVDRNYNKAQAKITRKMSALYQFYINGLIQNRCSSSTIKSRLP